MDEIKGIARVKFHPGKGWLTHSVQLPANQ